MGGECLKSFNNVNATVFDMKWHCDKNNRFLPTFLGKTG